MTDSVQVA